MILKRSYGVMLSLFVGGLVIGSGVISGHADDGAAFRVKITYMIKAIDDGEAEPKSRVFATREQQTRINEALPKNPELDSYWGSVTHFTRTSDPTFVWTYDRSQKPANVKIRYVNTQHQQVGRPQFSSDKFSQGGRMRMEAPAGYCLKNPEDRQRMAITSNQETWTIVVEPLEANQSGTESGITPITPAPDGIAKPVAPTPGPSIDAGKKPDEGPNKLPDKGIGQKPGKLPSKNPKPFSPNPRPIVPDSFPPATSGLVTPVDEQPLVVPRPQVSYPMHELDHVSELAEHPITSIGEEPLATPTNRHKRAVSPQISRKSIRTSDLAPVTAHQLPQTGEQATWAQILGMITLTGAGIVRFRRFRH